MTKIVHKDFFIICEMCHKQNIVPDIMHITSRGVIYMCDYEDYSFVVEKAYDKIYKLAYKKAK